MAKFKNHNPNKPYRCFLYKQIDGKTVSKIVTGEEAAQAGLDDGWVKSPSAFVDQAEGVEALNDDQVEKVKDAADMMARDADILANADTIDDIETLRTAYAQLAGKPMHHKVKSLEGTRNACHKLLGKLNDNSTATH